MVEFTSTFVVAVKTFVIAADAGISVDRPDGRYGGSGLEIGDRWRETPPGFVL